MTTSDSHTLEIVYLDELLTLEAANKGKEKMIFLFQLQYTWYKSEREQVYLREKKMFVILHGFLFIKPHGA